MEFHGSFLLLVRNILLQIVSISLLDMTKQCSVCGKEKDPWFDFYRKSHTQCIDCCRAKSRATYATRTPPKFSELPSEDKKKRYTQKKLRQYKLSAVELDTLYRSQEDKCAICFRSCRLDIDHSHATGKVRGLLCGTCNRGLGLFRDNIELLANAIDYLSKTDKSTTLNPFTRKIP